MGMDNELPAGSRRGASQLRTGAGLGGSPRDQKLTGRFAGQAVVARAGVGVLVADQVTRGLRGRRRDEGAINQISGATWGREPGSWRMMSNGIMKWIPFWPFTTCVTLASAQMLHRR